MKHVKAHVLQTADVYALKIVINVMIVFVTPALTSIMEPYVIAVSTMQVTQVQHLVRVTMGSTLMIPLINAYHAMLTVQLVTNGRMTAPNSVLPVTLASSINVLHHLPLILAWPSVQPEKQRIVLTEHALVPTESSLT